MSGELSCTAASSEGEDTKSVEIIVVEATSASDEEGPGSVTKNAGETLKLGCDVEADPEIVETVSRKWTKDDTEVGDELLDDEGRVSITYLVSENAGEYKCHVSTVVDSVTLSRHVTVVTEAPRVTETPPRLGGMEGDSVTIECQVTRHNIDPLCDNLNSPGLWHPCS